MYKIVIATLNQLGTQRAHSEFVWNSVREISKWIYCSLSYEKQKKILATCTEFIWLINSNSKFIPSPSYTQLFIQVLKSLDWFGFLPVSGPYRMNYGMK